MRGYGCSRKDRFEAEKSFLSPVSKDIYCAPIQKQVKVHSDCHIQFQKNYYSVPSYFVGQVLTAKLEGQTLGIYKDGDLLASHKTEASKTHAYVTNEKHYPAAKVAILNYSVQSAFEHAVRIGPQTHSLVKTLLTGTHPYRHLRRVQGILRGNKTHKTTGQPRFHIQEMEEAAAMCLQYKITSQFFVQCAKYHQMYKDGSPSNKAPTRERDTVYLDTPTTTPKETI